MSSFHRIALHRSTFTYLLTYVNVLIFMLSVRPNLFESVRYIRMGNCSRTKVSSSESL